MASAPSSISLPLHNMEIRESEKHLSGKKIAIVVLWRLGVNIEISSNGPEVLPTVAKALEDQIVVKKLVEEVTNDDDKLRAFIDELALLQNIRHPNFVQFLGAVTQSSPMMIVTEYLPKVKHMFTSYWLSCGSVAFKNY
ncbi:Protein kinase domain-containing protein [Heracleum sosnowskyi]|uniref:Protein kinase domain-containing protein n=1 Tax=Heracleum sosnowskyi TaxID=360622 RepID=A0AAD8HPI4_9APIA|nr:Protein kinase domain-containing protein [Heracleum sosnowskyi]